MFKKMLAAVFAVFMLLSVSACNLKTDSGKDFNADTTKQSFTEKSTFYHNVFKDRIPELDFKEEPVEKYEDAESYSFTVNCSEKEYDKFIKKLKKCGFENNLIEADGYFYAKDEDGYYAEIVYKNNILTVTIDR